MICPYRHDITTPPKYMLNLPVDKRGYPVPWFVDWIKGEPEFRAMDPRKIVKAIKDRRCWTCGNPLYREEVFVIGPMCAVNRISSEPPSHRECAIYSAQNCPFLTRPHAVRRTNDLPDERNVAGVMIERNPGVTLLWYTYRHEIIQTRAIPEMGIGAGVLFRLGRAFKTEWYCKGRPANRAEILESIDTGLPALYEANDKQGHGEEGRAVIEQQLGDALRLVPK